MTNDSGISNHFTIILDGNNLNEWHMDGKDKVVGLGGEEEKEQQKC